MNKISATLLLAASASLATAGTLTVDSFSLDQGPLTAAGSTGPLAIGGGISRTLTLSNTGGLPPVQNVLQVNSGILDMTNGSLDNSTMVVTYSLPALGVPVGATDLQLTLQVVQSDANLTSLAVGGLASGNFSIPGNTLNSTLAFGISGPPIGPGTLTLTFNGAAGWDLSIDSLGLSWRDPAPIPEPATYAMMGAGLIAVFMAKRRKA